MPTIYSSLDSAKNEFRILQLRSIAVSVAPNVQPSKTATRVDSNPSFQCTVCNTEGQFSVTSTLPVTATDPISYTWGDEVSSNPITVNGVEVLVTENLLAALKRFRKEHSDVHLWVDALCINQLDSSEKAEQVKHMADIYRNAARTLIWLGPEYDDSHNTISQLVKTGHKQFVVSPNLVLFCGRDEILYGVWQVASIAVLSLRNYLLRSITDSHDQQIKPGHRIYFGELLKINLNRMTKRALLRTRLVYQGDLDQPRSLFSAICSSQIPSKFNAKDDRDLIFALLGLTSDAEDTKLSPDYDESTTCQEVYTSAARYMIYQGDVDVLSLTQHRSTVHTGGLPNWVPDWRAKIYEPFGQTPLQSRFNVSGPAPFSLAIDHENLPENQLKLLGHLLSPVELSGTKAWGAPYKSWMETLRHRGHYLRSITTLCQKSDEKLMHPNTLPDPYPHPNDRASAEMSIPASGMEFYGVNRILQHANNPVDDHTELRKGFLSAMEATRLEARGPYNIEIDNYFTAMDLQGDRWGILLDNGLVGTGPTTVEIGDVVVIFKGAKFPYVLRRKGEGNFLHWTLVGLAYIHGTMYGELFEKSSEPDGLQLEEFLLVG
ncbi:heterokaryon incompatibility protein [Rutstroemia sp. NJR-2017a BVV2]|nr:heterokaryon incompatibility protein [Rutstroemia sp. NJR-2017a BVV2]